jgi:hypothetical protein
MDRDKQKHWETVYKTKQPNEVSWTQEIPKTSLDFIHEFNFVVLNVITIKDERPQNTSTTASPE